MVHIMRRKLHLKNFTEFVPNHNYWESLNSEETNRSIRSNIEANKTKFIITVEQKFAMSDVCKTETTRTHTRT